MLPWKQFHAEVHRLGNALMLSESVEMPKMWSETMQRLSIYLKQIRPAV